MGWKDELPRKGLAWSGRLLRGGGVVSGSPGCWSTAIRGWVRRTTSARTLGGAARRVAETLLASGPLPAAVLRQAVGLQGRRGGARFSAAVVELGRALVCASFGTEQVGAGRR
jgi:hypothetical protein